MSPAHKRVIPAGWWACAHPLSMCAPAVHMQNPPCMCAPAMHLRARHACVHPPCMQAVGRHTREANMNVQNRRTISARASAHANTHASAHAIAHPKCTCKRTCKCTRKRTCKRACKRNASAHRAYASTCVPVDAGSIHESMHAAVQ
eukprot:366406-Chlamydomonas_euryale.AAC.40